MKPKELETGSQFTIKSELNLNGPVFGEALKNDIASQGNNLPYENWLLVEVLLLSLQY